MSEDYHITSIERCEIEDFGDVIKVTACPYEDTPFGYCYIANKWEEFYFRYSKAHFEKLHDLKDKDDFDVNLENFTYNAEYGYIHNSCLEKNDYNTSFVPVDLGLSVLWADRNLGANTPSDYGVMKSYDELISSNLIPKGWRLPTSKEFEELEELSHRTRGKKNYCYFGNGEEHLYMPPAGCASGLNVYRQGQWGEYLGVYPNKEDVQCTFHVAVESYPFISASFDGEKIHSIRFVKDK